MTDETPILIERAITRELDAEGWSRLADLAENDPQIYRLHFEHARDQHWLSSGQEALTERVAPAELPEHRNFRPHLRAAAVLLVAVTAFLCGRMQERPLPSTGSAPALSLDEQLERYVRLGQEEGRVLFELRPRVIEARRSEGDAVEVLLVRQIVERASTASVITVERDEYGRARERLLAADDIPEHRSY